MTFELTRRASDTKGWIATYYKTDIPVADDNLDTLKATIQTAISEPLELKNSPKSVVILLVDMKAGTYIVEILEPITAPYIHRLQRQFEA